jgi:N-glycosidase YbiA
MDQITDTPGWLEYKRIAELPEVDETLRLFAEGETTQDQAICIVRAVLEATAKPTTNATTSATEGAIRPLDSAALEHTINMMPWRDVAPLKLRQFGTQLWAQFCSVPADDGAWHWVYSDHLQTGVITTPGGTEYEIRDSDMPHPRLAKVFDAMLDALVQKRASAAVPAGWRFAVTETDGRVWLNIHTPTGRSAAVSAMATHNHGMHRTITALVLDELKDALSAAPKPDPAVGGMELHGLDTAERVCFYEQDFYVLSNFSSFRVGFGGQNFDTSEAAYHYQRFTDIADQTCILHAESAHEAFRYAQENKSRQRPDWDVVKVDIMRDILRAKAAQHEYVRRKLLATGDRELVENSWRDSYWGWGPNKDGHNMLGKLWMQIRAELRAAMALKSGGEE